jgi:membrane protease YdiL (CAAX protease family)
MFDRYLTYYKPGKQILCLSLVFLACFVFTSVLSFIITPKISGGMSYMEFASSLDFKNIQILEAMKILQVIAQVCMFLLPALLFGYLAYPSASKYLGIYLPEKKIHWYWTAILILVALPFMSLLEQWNAAIPLSKTMIEMEKQGGEITKAFLQGTSLSSLLINLLIVAFLPAVVEELLFRGCLQNVLLVWLKKTPITAIIITAIIFSLIHGQMAGFFPRMFAGVLLGLVYYYSGSILPSIFMHFINNGLSVVLYFFYNKGMISKEIVDGKSPLFIGLLSAISCGIMIYLFNKNKVNYKVHQVQQDDELFDENSILN